MLKLFGKNPITTKQRKLFQDNCKDLVKILDPLPPTPLGGRGIK